MNKPLLAALALAFASTAVLAPSFPQDRFTLQKGRRMAQIGQEKAQPASLATRLVPGLLYGQEHACGRPASGTTQSVEGITREDLAGWHAAWFKPGSAPARQMAVANVTAGRKLYLTDKPDAPQSTIVRRAPVAA